MSRVSNKWIAAAIAAITLSLTTVALAGGICATVVVGVDHAIAQPGQTVVATATANNCGGSTAKFLVTYVVTDACGVSRTIGSTAIKLRAGETQSTSISFAAPSCPGETKVTATVSPYDPAITSSSSTTFTVAP